MSRREYPMADRYDDRQSDFYRRPRTERNYDELDVDISRSRVDGPAPSRRAETVVKERERDETVVSRRTERGPRQPDFLREDYGRNSNAGPLVVQEDRREDDYVSWAPNRRRSLETVRSRAPPERMEKDEVVFRERERERDRGPPYPRSERDFIEKDEVTYRERTRSRPPRPREERSEERIDIRIREEEKPEWRPPPREPPRSEVKEEKVEEIRFRRGDGGRPPPPRTEIVEREEIRYRDERSTPPPARTVREVDKEEITFQERRSSPPREPYRGREVREKEIDIDIRERNSPPRARSQSRGALVRKVDEEWVVRRRRSPTPPPRDYEKEEIIIRRREPEPEPEPPREPTPEPPLPPPPEPIYRPPIVQEIITHHRHIDHGVERVRPLSPPPPAPPSPPREDNLEIEIRRTGTRNGKAYEEDIVFERDVERKKEDEVREVDTRRSVSTHTRRRSPSQLRRRYDDDVAVEADFYNRKVSSRAYPGEAWNGATRDWGLVDVPPGTERVRMDGIGGGRQEIMWERYNGERRGKFFTGDRIYEADYGNGIAPPPLPAAEPPRDEVHETRITERRVVEETGGSKGKTKDRMWTEITKDLVIKEAIEEQGYEYEETDGFFYVIEYLRYEDVLRLVELTEDIRRERRERIREIQWEREEQERLPKMLPPPPPVPAPPRNARYDERVYEREYVYDRDGRRYR